MSTAISAGALTPACESDLAYQRHILQGVSRTFALTIPQLPPPLYDVVANAYLLCRIADTIEDDAGLGSEDKRRFAEEFIEVVAGNAPAEGFAAGLHPRLGASTLDAERDLVRNTASVARVTHAFREPQQQALLRCVRVMSRGMAEFQEGRTPDGLEDLAHLDRYCYHVAGVVGEMLTELFCDYSATMAGRRQEMLRLAVSFGQGLQMTNILKDVWEDRQRGACWLPRDLFLASGFELRDLSSGRSHPAFREGLAELIGVARLHLANALAYTLLVPRSEKGIRRFCLWALGMAVLTLRKIHTHPGFTRGADVKISRNSVRATILVTNAAAAQDAVLRALFDLFTRDLPVPEYGGPVAAV